MPLQRGKVTLAQILGSPTASQGQTPPRAITIAVSTPPPASPVIVATTAPTRKTRVRWKRLKGAGFKQPVTIHDSKNSSPDLGDTYVDVVGALAYMKEFMVGGEVFLATDKVRP